LIALSVRGQHVPVAGTGGTCSGETGAAHQEKAEVLRRVESGGGVLRKAWGSYVCVLWTVCSVGRREIGGGRL
jgi:hypothetical protein